MTVIAAHAGHCRATRWAMVQCRLSLCTEMQTASQTCTSCIAEMRNARGAPSMLPNMSADCFRKHPADTPHAHVCKCTCNPSILGAFQELSLIKTCFYLVLDSPHSKTSLKQQRRSTPQTHVPSVALRRDPYRELNKGVGYEAKNVQGILPDNLCHGICDQA